MQLVEDEARSRAYDRPTILLDLPFPSFLLTTIGTVTALRVLNEESYTLTRHKRSERKSSLEHSQPWTLLPMLLGLGNFQTLNGLPLVRELTKRDPTLVGVTLNRRLVTPIHSSETEIYISLLKSRRLVTASRFISIFRWPSHNQSWMQPHSTLSLTRSN